jgi:hypothetical protein
MNWPRSLLLLIGLGFLGFGVGYALWPLPMARLTDIPLPSPTARVDFAATYGGLQIGLGIFLLKCARRAIWFDAGLWAAAAALTGMVLIRLQSILVAAGPVTRAIWIGVTMEALGALATGLTLRYRRGGPGTIA